MTGRGEEPGTALPQSKIQNPKSKIDAVEEPFSLTLIARVVAQIFPTGPAPAVERVREGGSTYVYRIHHTDQLLYLRVLPELGRSFAPEQLAHRLLRQDQIAVPAVVYFAHCQADLGRSVMVTTAIRGAAIGHATSAHEIGAVLRAAGRDLARIHRIPVAGFGWICRDRPVVTHLQAEFPTCGAFIRDHFDPYLELLARTAVLNRSEIAAMREIRAAAAPLLDVAQAYLVHGDFDATHIYAQEGQYTGIIDFGEIRGADLWYDLGHFQLENSAQLPYLLEGYAEVRPLPPDYAHRMGLYSLLIAIRRLGRRVEKAPSGGPPEPDLALIRRVLRDQRA
ncbi:MAG TPA: aminoglycoside phosphotransferase family protein [Chloroflexia bacterium]|nr:aminoglycoside phosphotransferase family protein [Chloroflexia bacterium]